MKYLMCWQVVETHTHDGFYGDGNSSYWREDRQTDLAAMTVTITRVESVYGQLAPNGHFQETTQVYTRPANLGDDAIQLQVLQVLDPLLDTCRRNPGRETFGYSSRKHKYLIDGRISKAIKLLRDTDSVTCDLTGHTFVLPAAGVVVKVWHDRRTWGCQVVDLTEIVEEEEG